MDECDQNLLGNDGQFSLQLIDPLQQTQEESQYQKLKYKLTELQKVIKSLSSSNQKFLDKIIELQDQLQLQQNQRNQFCMFDNDYSILQNQLNHIQALLQQYKIGLQKYQQNNQSIIKQKDNQIMYLKQEIQKMTQNEISFLDKLSEKDQQSKFYTQMIQKLQQQLQAAKQQAVSKKYEGSTKKSKRTNDNSSQLSSYRQSYEPFSEKVHHQLQILIQKLVRQLQFQRNHKKEYKNEIKKLQNTVMSLQKQINKKTNLIYSQQIKIVKLNQSTNSNQNYHNKTLSNIHTSSQKTFVNRPYYQQEQKEVKYQRGTFHFKNNYNIVNRINRDLAKPVQVGVTMTKKGKGVYHQEAKIIKQISLKQIIEEKIKLQCRQKCILSVKIIDFLLNNTHNSHLSPQNLIIKNYNAQSFSHCILKARSDSQDDFNALQGAQLIENIIFLLNLVMNNIEDADMNFGLKSNENKMLSYLCDLTENSDENTLQDIQQIKKIIQQMIYQKNN